ncbi:MAG: hypothetical protein HKN82_05695 [Akkermansiaceae bacterium]|nr:hypothetical protein [Akkermansiaceae bacterium]
MIQFRLFGIPVVVQPIFWITLGIIGALYTRPSNGADFLNLGLFMLAGFLSILVHEFGHALTVKSFGAPSAITLHSFGGFATYPAGVLNRPKSFLVTAAGPGIQLLLGAAALPLLLSGVLPDTPIKTFVWWLVAVSFFWAIINCLPIYPMDGGRMLESILGPRRIKVVFIIGIVTALGLGLACVVLWKETFMALLMGLFAWENYNHYRQAR